MNHRNSKVSPVRRTKAVSARFISAATDCIHAAGRSSLYTVAKTAFDLATEHAAEQFTKAEREFRAAVLLMILFFGLGALTAYYVIYRVTGRLTIDDSHNLHPARPNLFFL